jgi:CspA family cold shock protein
MQGTVKWFSDEKGYGFIVPDDKGVPDVFVHFSGIDASGHRTLVEGERVEFEIGENPKNGRDAALAVRSLGVPGAAGTQG